MRKIIISAILLVSSLDIQAQSLSDLFKAFSSSSDSTETIEESTTETLTATTMIGEWSFSKLAVDLSDDSSLKGFAGSAIIGQVESMLNSTASSSGITEGMFTITFATDMSAVILFKDSQKSISLTYAVDVEQSTISMEIGTIDSIEIGTLAANVKLTDESATLLVDAKTLIAIADQIPDIADNSQYQMVRGVASSVSGLLMGFSLQR